MPKLPDAKSEKFIKQYKLPVYEINLLSETIELTDYFENTCQKCQNYKLVSNWILKEVRKLLNKEKIIR